jgi:CheY-like chemotaxis protein
MPQTLAVLGIPAAVSSAQFPREIGSYSATNLLELGYDPSSTNGDMISSPTTSVTSGRSARPGPEITQTADFLSTRRRKKVLIADDSLVFLGALSMKLRRHGYDVAICQQGARIVSIARIEKPDLILLDINFLPDPAHGTEEAWDGLLVLEWLSRLDETKHTPVMVISGEDPARFRARSLSAGAVAFFEKPIRPATVLRAIQLALGDRTDPSLRNVHLGRA